MMRTERSDAATVRERLRTMLATATRRLAEAGVPSPSVDARALLERAARADGPLVLLDALPESCESDLRDLVARRAAREPLQLILGEAPFRRLSIRVRPGVFIPRPETELVIDLLLAFHRERPVRRIADLCSGSGALAAAVLDEIPGARVLAVEVDPLASDLATENLARVDDGAGRADVRTADVTDPEALIDVRGLDAVLSNPPYVPPGAVPREEEVRLHDPERALYGGGADGLEVPAAILERAAEMLRPGGLLIMEHADVQGEGTRALATAHGAFTAVRTQRDLTGRDRFLVARRRWGTAPAKVGD